MTEQKLIAKEDIPNYTIVPATVNNSADWVEKLNYAVRLGNEFKSKTSISFSTTEGEKTVATTVWSLTEKYIQLKGGINIPLDSITNIAF